MEAQNRRDFIKTVALGACTTLLPGCSNGRQDSSLLNSSDLPNIILIMIDDMGWMDLHCQGNQRLDTPNIDRLASQGMRFTDAYSAAPVCSPTRAAILTGQSPARLGITNHIPDREDFLPDDPVLLPAEMLDHLPLEHVTIAERLKKVGYATAFMGKWHLSGSGRREEKGIGLQEFHPEWQGYDVNIGGCAYGGPPTYFDPYLIHNLEPRREGEYLPYRLADEAIAFIQSHRDEQFFLTLWNYTVHWPMEAPESLIDKYGERVGPGLKDPRYGAMIEALDTSIGRIMSALDELELTHRTVVIFTSDNGGYSGVADNRPLRSGKGYLYEGGIRVPLIVRWPGVVGAGTLCHTPVISMDFHPTLLDVAGIEEAAGSTLDGENLMPLLKQTGTLQREALYFHYPNYAWHRSNRLGGAIRQGDYKLIEWYDDSSVELYDLAHDLGEEHNLSSQMLEMTTGLKRKLDSWLVRTGAKMPTRP